MALSFQVTAPCSKACGWVACRRRPAGLPASATRCQQQQRWLQQRAASSGPGSSRAAPAAGRLAAVQEGSEGPGSTPLVAVEGDIVTLNWKCFSEEGELLESSDTNEEPTTFEVGAGDIVGNRLFEAFDEAVRGLAVGDATRIQAEGGEWKEELMFRVPREHPEIQRLEGRYKNQGGLKEGLLAELSNGGMALVVKVDEEAVILDANNMLAGKKLWFELELAAIDRPGQ